jgi:hypothetical protein
MIKLVLQLLLGLEQFFMWIRDQRIALFKSKLNLDTIDALKLSKEKKDTSKLDEIFNNSDKSLP